uniref:Uncharacterized protein n=1 Tax=Wuchereria bancrofti TaxID=6293 RepID=A0AAF5PHR1_WUCBA
MVIPRRRDQYVLPFVLFATIHPAADKFPIYLIIICPLSFQVHTHTCTHIYRHQNGLVCQTTREMMDDMWCEDVGREEIDQSCKIVEDGDSVYRRRGGKGRVAECYVGCRCAIAVLTMRRYKDRSLDVCTLEVEVNAKVMR